MNTNQTGATAGDFVEKEDRALQRRKASLTSVSLKRMKNSTVNNDIVPLVPKVVS